MRYSVFLLMLAVAIVSCKKEFTTSTVVLNEAVDTTIAVLKLTGDFMDGPYGTTTGKAEVYKTGSKFQVKLSGFMVNNGPALHVYLSKEAMPINYIDLGALKAIAGSQVYDVPNMPDFSIYPFISIHCVAYNHLFGYALLQ